MKEKYLELLQWLNENPNFSFWVVSFSLGFLFLILIYLFISNLRLHFHINSIIKDKNRLMSEKDLMRKGWEESQNKESN